MKPRFTKTALSSASILVLLLCVLALAPAGRCAYIDKEDKDAYSTPEPIPAPGAPGVTTPIPGQYPYYGNAPADMLPYRNIEPYYRYWLERLPFRGPGRDYPDPTN